MDRVTLSGLIKIELPAATIRFCDGAFVIWSAETFESEDTDFGVLGGVEPVQDGVGDELPALRMTLFPKSTAAAADLSQPGYQGSRVRMWIAEVDLDTNETVGDPALMFDGQIDSTVLTIDRGSRSLEIDVVPNAERLFIINEGNTLSPRFHKSLYAGELGEDNAIGVGIGVAWGTAQPTGYSGAGMGGAGGNIDTGRTWLDAIRR